MAEHVCPWWLGYFHLGPIRRLLQDPGKILTPLVREGMTILDIGPGMGFFTLEMAKLAGPGGRVVAIDLQPKMIAALERRARRAGVADRVDARVCEAKSLGAEDLSGSIDLAFAFYVIHEMPDVPHVFEQVHRSLVPGGTFLIVEPIKRVPHEEFELNITRAGDIGFSVVERPDIRKSRSVLLARN